MKKEQFLRDLSTRLVSLPHADVKRSLDYYSEMIDDRIEDGLSEEEAVKKIGTPAKAAEEILVGLPITTLALARMSKKRSALTTTLIILAAPIWIPLLAVAFSVVITIFAVLFSALAVFFSLFIALWATEIGLAAGAVAGPIGCLLAMILEGQILFGILLLGASFVLAALAIFGFFGTVHGTKGLLFLCGCVLKLYGLIWRFIKFCLIRKETIQ